MNLFFILFHFFLYIHPNILYLTIILWHFQFSGILKIPQYHQEDIGAQKALWYCNIFKISIKIFTKKENKKIKIKNSGWALHSNLARLGLYTQLILPWLWFSQKCWVQPNPSIGLPISAIYANLVTRRDVDGLGLDRWQSCVVASLNWIRIV